MDISNRAIQTVYTLWLREMLRYGRSKSRIIGSLASPLFFLILLGNAFKSSLQFRVGGDYTLDFMAPGIIAMSILFSSIAGGVSIIWDREFGFLKEILIAPVNRFFVALGKAVGGVTTAMIQGTLILIIAGLIGVKYHSLLGILLSVIVMFFIGLGFIGLGIALASKIESFEGFNLVMNFITLPVFFLSGALFPITKLPTWLKTLIYFNPLTYGVDALRAILLEKSEIPLYVDISVIVGFAIFTIAIGGWLFNKTSG